MTTGFSNEKSAEYVIINDLYDKIKNECSFFYPFLYQSKRDDTMLSLQNNIDSLGLIVCFARRSKVCSIYDDVVEITFRETLFKHSNYFYNKGVNSIIGAPIGSRIEEIGFGSKCKWFYPEKNVDCDYSFCQINKNNLELLKNSRNVNELEVNEIINIMKCTKNWKWSELVKLLKDWHTEEKYNSFNFSRFGFWIRGQRPIFVVYRLK